MDNDEKFFEELAMKRAHDEEEFEVELTKAKTLPVETKPRRIEERKDDEAEGTLTIDVYQTPTNIIIESAIAGVSPEDLDITATSDSVIIKGERQRSREVNEKDYFYRECYWGKFSRTVILPQEVDPDGAEVSFKNGVLIISIPKLSKQKTKRLSVKTD